MDCVDPDVRKRPKMGHVIRTLEADDLFFHDERRIAREHSEVDRQADEMSLYDSSQLKKSSYHMQYHWEKCRVKVSNHNYNKEPNSTRYPSLLLFTVYEATPKV
ncbi:hypothetical protein V6N11_034626 [Hibiscus sabdariffa]|uniref:Uncharacterized protein n=1 Tax=Hibiscus sabdariffa TaxID=183260 RepID=A0ABR2NDK9_9ROSI